MRIERQGIDIYLLRLERRRESEGGGRTISFDPDDFLSLFIGKQERPSLELTREEAQQLATELLRLAAQLTPAYVSRLETVAVEALRFMDGEETPSTRSLHLRVALDALQFAGRES